MLTLNEITQPLSFAGLVGSAIALIATTTIFDNSKLASLSTLSATVSLYAYTKVEQENTQDRLREELETSQASLTEARATLQATIDQNAAQEAQLISFQSGLNQLKSRLEDATERLTIVTGERESLKLEADCLQGQIVSLEGIKSQWAQKFDQMILANAQEVDALNAKVNELSLENIQFKAQFTNADEVAKLRAQQEFYETQQKLEAVKIEYGNVLKKYAEVATLYNSLRSEHLALNDEYVREFTELNEAVSKELPTAFQTVLDTRDQELMRLSGHLNVLLQPQYFEAIGEYDRANRLIKALWEGDSKICLDASEIVPYADQTGFDVYLNLRDRKSRGQAFIDGLNAQGNEFSVICGCIKDLKFEYDRINPHRVKTSMVFRKAQKAESKATIDKLWIPADQFGAKVPKLLKKPMTRVMGSTGEGKGVFVNLLLAIEANQAVPALVGLHDPMDSSEEDHWNLPKASKGAAQSLKAVKAFIAEFDRRSENGVAHPRTLDIFDEIDILADRDSSVNKSLLNCAKGMRHNGMRACLMGQSPSVGKKGLEWADLDNFNCVYFGTAIYTAIDKTPALESKSEALRKEYEKLKEYCDRQNEELGLDGWNEYRTGLIVIQGKAYFFELPNADSIVCDWSKLTESSAEIAAHLEAKTTSEQSHLGCPECGSVNLRNKGKTKDGNSNYMKCRSCEHNFKVSL
jgi:predicted  nucleic acid-binding Zn-ribbon protein